MKKEKIVKGFRLVTTKFPNYYETKVFNSQDEKIASFSERLRRNALASAEHFIFQHYPHADSNQQVKFARFLEAVSVIGGEYEKGYKKGLKGLISEEDKVDASQHDRYILMSGSQQEFGDGYRDGCAGRPPKGIHGNIGNTHAQGELPANAQLQVRINRNFKKMLEGKAKNCGLSLSKWVLETLTLALEKEVVNGSGDFGHPANTQLQIRLNEDIKHQFEKKADREGLLLSKWVLKTLEGGLHE